MVHKGSAALKAPDQAGSELRQTIRVSTTEGVYAQIYYALSGPGSVFLTKFCVLLSASPIGFGILSAIGQISQLFQPLGAALTQMKTSRKGIVLRLIAAGRFLTFFYGFLPLFFPAGVRIWVFLLLFFFSASLQAAGGNAWIAWISDMVPLRYRGRFFSRRSQYLMIAGLITGYAAGAFIDLYSSQPSGLTRRLSGLVSHLSFFYPANAQWAFVGIFVLAAVIGLVGLKILARQPERAKPVESGPFLALVKEPFRDPNFRNLLLYGVWWMLTIGVGSPFWGPFMIKKLGMSIVNIQIYGMISTIASFAALRYWGKFIDRFGNKTAMRFAIILGGLNPMLWLFVTPQNYLLIYVEAFFSGIMWSGANIVATNFVLSVAPVPKRQMYSAVFGAVLGISIMVTMLACSIYLPPPMTVFGLRLEPEQVLFGLTGLLRFTTQIPLSRVREVRSRPVAEALVYIQNYVFARVMPGRKKNGT
jgi:MFS family permease